MYIGAWTEYRLAQEQAQSRRHHDDAQGCERRPRKGAGIYHPSLSDKGGTDVARLPDRESFRRTLESALTSNLAADDAENISQALEPLMQRLPTIHPRAAVSRKRLPGSRPSSVINSTHHRRRQQEVTYEARHIRCQSSGWSPRKARTHSDAGTRSARLPTPDGTRSPRSGFSSASAPLAVTAGPDNRRARSRHFNDSSTKYGQQRRRGRRGSRSRIPQLPLIIGIRRPRQNSLDNDALYPGNTRGPADGINSDQASEKSQQGKSQKLPGEEQVAATTTDDRFGVKLAAADGGYDGEAATAILRLARRRDPAGLKADFEQFWTWKKRAGPTSSTAKAAAVHGSSRHPDKHSFPVTAAGGEGTPGVAASKLEMLTRMKAVYLPKEVTSGESAPASECTSPKSPDRPSPTPHPPDGTSCATPSVDCTDAGMTTRSSEDAMGLAKQRSRLGDEEPFRSGDSVTGRGADDIGSNFGEEDATIHVPDLELTDSRIKLVEKYFRGGGGGGGGVDGARPRQEERPADQEKGVSGPHATSLAAGRAIGSSWGRDCLPGAAAAQKVGEDEEVPPLATYRIGICDDDAFRDRTGGTSCGAGGVSGAAKLHRESAEGVASDEVVDATTSARPGGSQVAYFPPEIAPPAVSMGWTQDVPPRPTGLRETRGRTGGPSNTLEKNLCGETAFSPEKGRTPLDTATSGADAATALSPPAAIAPAWCADSSSLEDLVYWTKGLDYDAAVKGY